MPSVAIVTRNAVYGGVETMVSQHQRLFDATVFVAGGSNQPETCPFRYTYVDDRNPARAYILLARWLRKFDVIIYHWLPSWAQESVRQSGRPCIEVVHRDDTADNDKTIPDLVVTHSQYLAEFLWQTHAIKAEVIPHAVDVDRYPSEPEGLCVGAITSYYANKGIDVLLNAWAAIEGRFPQHTLRLYGSGSDRAQFEALAEALGLKSAELLGPLTDPASHYSEFSLFAQPSRAEGMPFAVMEALASNVPVIASSLPAMLEFNHFAEERGYPGLLTLFQSDDSADLAEKITYCLNNLDSQVRGREYIRRFYGLEQHRNLYAQALQQAMAAHRRRVEQVEQVKRLDQDRHWRGWRSAPKRVAHNLYHVVVPRAVRYAAWAFRHRSTARL
jgi:glycosyltransferase involved in cell wall biosynthesis